MCLPQVDVLNIGAAQWLVPTFIALTGNSCLRNIFFIRRIDGCGMQHDDRPLF